MRVTCGANTFDMQNERVSHVERLSLCLRAHAFHLLSKRVYLFVRTRFTREANAFIFSCARVSHEENAVIHVHVYLYDLHVEFARVFPEDVYICVRRHFMVNIQYKEKS